MTETFTPQAPACLPLDDSISPTLDLLDGYSFSHLETTEAREMAHEAEVTGDGRLAGRVQ
jgi:hypothetical protein